MTTSHISKGTFVVVVLYVVFGLPSPSVAAEVVVTADQNVEAVVAAHAAGTTYLFEPGVYRLVSIAPKTGDTFLGSEGTILNGSRLLTDWVQSGAYWYVNGQTQQGQRHGECTPEYPRCGYPEDVFVNDVPIRHVESLAKVNANSYYFDYSADRIYLGQNPMGKKIEVATTRVAFQPTADNVTVRGFVVEKYAVPNQMGAIGDQYPRGHWLIEENEVRLNHGVGVTVGDHGILRNNYIHRNGQMAAGTDGDSVRIEGNEFAHNLWNGTNWGWEGGGTKFAETEGLVVRNNYVHDNAGPGLWTDINNIHTLYEYNTVIHNDAAGLKHEISYDAVMRNNILAGNGRVNGGWIWNGQVEIQNSSHVSFHNNYVHATPGTYGHGVSILEQNRGAGTYGPYLAKNNDVYNNVIVLERVGAKNGAVQDTGNSSFFTPTWNNTFRNNTYHVSDTGAAMFAWQNSDVTWGAWQNYSQDTGGSITTASASAQKPIVSVSVNNPHVASGQPVVLSYEGLLATQCSAAWKTGTWVSGSVTVYPTESTVYQVTCSGYGGTATDSVAVSVDESGQLPEAPSNLAAISQSTSTIQLSWVSASSAPETTQNGSGELTYLIERCLGVSCTTFTQVGTSSSTGYTDKSLTSSTTYRYRVRARDVLGNTSPYSNLVSATTQRALTHEVVFADGFESALLWTRSGSVTWYSGLPKTGTRSVRLRKNGSLQKTIPLTGYESVTVSFAMGARSLDNSNENLQVHYYNGTTWILLAAIADKTSNENNRLNPYAFALPATVANSPTFALRFQLNGSSNDDYGFVDSVAVSGLPIVSTFTEVPRPSLVPGGFPGSPLHTSAPSTLVVGDLTQPLAYGMRHQSVVALQKALNSNPSTMVAAAGIGSAGYETDYFGALTMRAVQNFQSLYRIVSTGTPETTGFGKVGPRTLEKIKELFTRE